MRLLCILGLVVMTTALTGCGEEAQEKAMRQEIAKLQKFTEKMQTGLDQRKQEIDLLKKTMQEKAANSLAAQEQIQRLQEKIVSSEKANLEKMAELQKKYETARQERINADKEFAERDKELAERDKGHDAVDMTLKAKTKQLETEVAAKKKEVKEIRNELRKLRSTVEQQTFQLLQLNQNKELQETGMSAE